MDTNFYDFLIKYTDVNKKFIEDFRDIINEKFIENNTDFVIDGDIFIKWLGVKIKDNFVTTLKKSFELNIDYIVKNVGKGKKHKLLKYILTPNAAKMYAMNTKTIKGRDVRQYFISLESALYRYQKYIINGLHKNIL